MNWALAGQIAVVWIVIGVLASPLVGRYLANRRIRNELKELLNSSDAEWAVQHRAWMARRRSGEEVKLSREALIDIAEEESRPFALDENEQPHKPAA